MAKQRKRRTAAYKHRKLLDTFRPHYDHQLALQAGGCAICGRSPSERRRLDIDHDHRQMVIRGLLCVRCNRLLAVWVTAEWLRAAAEYLESPPAGWFTSEIKED